MHIKYIYVQPVFPEEYKNTDLKKHNNKVMIIRRHYPRQQGSAARECIFGSAAFYRKKVAS